MPRKRNANTFVRLQTSSDIFELTLSWSNLIYDSAYELYENLQYHTLTQDAVDKGEKYSSADNFKRTFSYDVKVHFVGAW